MIAQERIGERFDRYLLTNGYNAVINQRQFQAPSLTWPTEYRRPELTYRDGLTLTRGGLTFELFHVRGETDDATVAWIPEHRILCPGDMFIWVTPNCGNPQKVQRYPREWALALRRMAALGAEIMLPSHGAPVFGAERIRQALTETAEWLESLIEQTLDGLNSGARLDDLVQSVRPPAHLADRVYLQAKYDEPEFIVRNLWRGYAGWYDGNPAHLKPAPDARLAAALAELAGGARSLTEAARRWADAGELRLAGHLAELAVQAAPEDAALHTVRAEVNEARAAAEDSLMARGIFSWAAAESRRLAGGDADAVDGPAAGLLGAGTSSRGQASPNSVRIAYAVGGLLFGAAWALGRGDPWWEHLVRATVLLLAVVPPAQLLRRRQAGAGARGPAGRCRSAGSCWPNWCCWPWRWQPARCWAGTWPTPTCRSRRASRWWSPSADPATTAVRPSGRA